MLEHLEDLDAHRPFRGFRYILPHKDGVNAWYSTSGRPVFDENQSFAGYRGVSNNITAQVNLEDALREVSNVASAANEAKSEFLSSMSHELRTPLNSILGFGQLLELDNEHPLSADQADGVRQILKGGKHLLKLIGQVLDLSRIEQGHLSVSLEDIDPGEVLEDCLSLVRQQARPKGLSVERTGLDDQTLPILQADTADIVDGHGRLMRIIQRHGRRVAQTAAYAGARPREKVYLARKFGDAYLTYKTRVRRWI
jgi:signal transduction histidine kinase